MSLIVPLSFDYSDGIPDPVDFELSLHGGLATVRWPRLELSLSYSCAAETVALSDGTVDPTRLVPDHDGFTLHRFSGFTLGRYSEFFVYDLDWHREVRRHSAYLGSVEVTVGEPSPMATHLFASLYDSDYMPEEDHMATIRLLGADVDNVETYLLNALCEMQIREQLRLGLFDLGPLEAFLDDDEEATRAPSGVPVRLPAPPSDLAACRMFYAGLRADDVTYAFLEFYRVLEYYSVLSVLDQVTASRWDRELSGSAFLQRVTQLVLRDDRDGILRLVASLTDPQLLAQARDANLIQDALPHVLAGELYAHRNSLVHGKYGRRDKLHTRSLLAETPSARAWAAVAQSLARRAMHAHGTRNG